MPEEFPKIDHPEEITKEELSKALIETAKHGLLFWKTLCRDYGRDMAVHFRYLTMHIIDGSKPYIEFGLISQEQWNEVVQFRLQLWRELKAEAEGE